MVGLPLEVEPPRIFNSNRDTLSITYVKHGFQQRPQLLLTANGLQADLFRHLYLNASEKVFRLRETIFLPRFSLSALTILAQQPLLGRTR
jgi:hypothetical protein